jgi:hypothetical protein
MKCVEGARSRHQNLKRSIRSIAFNVMSLGEFSMRLLKLIVLSERLKKYVFHPTMERLLRSNTMRLQCSPIRRPQGRLFDLDVGVWSMRLVGLAFAGMLVVIS